MQCITNNKNSAPFFCFKLLKIFFTFQNVVQSLAAYAKLLHYKGLWRIVFYHFTNF